ncbi:MAG: PaaI family thioesterase [Lachnospiraceae bacterium]|nr:PaaI family thioesterase [Lachnospiraceae bacterium]
MGTFSSLEEAREYFKGDRFATDSGMVLDEFGDGTASCSVELGEGHRNANGGIMGGVMFTLADFAFAVAANNKHMPTVAQQVSINYLNAAKSGRLTAKASCIKDGRSTCVYNVDVTDDSGRDIARFTATGFKL